jgi:hypothetical protein
MRFHCADIVAENRGGERERARILVEDEVHGDVPSLVQGHVEPDSLDANPVVIGKGRFFHGPVCAF